MGLGQRSLSLPHTYCEDHMVYGKCSLSSHHIGNACLPSSLPFLSCSSLPSIKSLCWQKDLFEMCCFRIHFNLLLLIFLFFSLYDHTSSIWKLPSWGQIRAAAVSLCHSHSNADLSCTCNLCHSLWQCCLFNPPSEARDRTHILMNTMSGS